MSTIATLTSQRRRSIPRNKAAPLTTEQRTEKREARAQTQAAIDEEVHKWFSATMAKANELSEKFNKKPRYFLDLFFQGGARLVNVRGTSAWNAFMSQKAEEINGG